MKNNKTNKNLQITLGLGAGFILTYKIIKSLYNRYSYKDKVVLVTGGSRGLGLVIARKLASEGAHVAICSRNAGDLQKAKENLNQYGGIVKIYTCDVSDKTQVDFMIKQINEDFKRIDVVVNVAGTIQVGPAQLMTQKDFIDSFNSNFWGSFNTSYAVLPAMAQRKEGRIINISSIGGKITIPHLLPYNAAKFALTAFSEGLNHEVQKDGIKITTVFPGLIRTGSHRNALVKGDFQKEYAFFNAVNAFPLFSVSVNKAANLIIEAGREGKATYTFPFYARFITVFHALFPGLFHQLMVLTAQLLPSYEGRTTETRKGFESESAFTQSLLTKNIREESKKNNEE